MWFKDDRYRQVSLYIKICKFHNEVGIDKKY